MHPVHEERTYLTLPMNDADARADRCLGIIPQML